MDKRLIYGIVFLIMGYLMVFRVHIFWEMMNSKDPNRAAEPTKKFTLVCRISGVCAAVIGAVVIVYALFS